MTVAKVMTEEEVSFQKARSNVYLFLANAFLGNWQKLKEVAAMSEESVDDPLTNIITELRTTPLEELVIQFDNLFVAPGHYFVPPIASYHLSLQDEDLEQFLESLNSIYLKWGYSLPYENFERADHIGYLLLFIHVKIEALLNSSQVDIDADISFIKNYLQSWLLILEQEVEKKLNKGIVLEIVRYTRSFINWDLEQLDSFAAN